MATKITVYKRYSNSPSDTKVVAGQNTSDDSTAVEVQLEEIESTGQAFTFSCPWCNKAYCSRGTRNLIVNCVKCGKQMMVTVEGTGEIELKNEPAQTAAAAETLARVGDEPDLLEMREKTLSTMSQSRLILKRQNKLALSVWAYHVYMDGNKIGEIRNAQCKEFAVISGQHQLYVSRAGLKSKPVSVTFVEGQPVELICITESGLLGNALWLRQKKAEIDNTAVDNNQKKAEIDNTAVDNNQGKVLLYDLLFIGLTSLVMGVVSLIGSTSPLAAFTVGAVTWAFLMSFLYATYASVMSTQKNWWLSQSNDSTGKNAIRAWEIMWPRVGWGWIILWPFFGWFVWYILWDLWRKYVTARYYKNPIDMFWLKPFGAQAQQSPTVAPKKPGVDVSKVVFVKEQRKIPAPGFTQVYKVYRAPDLRTAKAFLAQNPVTRMHQYLIVETPQGNVGRDISGAFTESTGAELSLADVEGISTGTLIWYGPTGVARGLWLEQIATAYALDPSGARTKSFEATFAPCDDKGEIIAAIFPQLPVGDYEIHCDSAPDVQKIVLGGSSQQFSGGLRKVTVRRGAVTEVDKS